MAVEVSDQPSVVNVIDDVDQYTGNVENDSGVTNDAQPEIVGTAKAGDLVTVYDTFNGERVVLGSATADANGLWALQLEDDGDAATVDTLLDGDHNISVISNVGTVTESSESGKYSFEVDTVAPSKPTGISLTDDQGVVVGAIDANNDPTDDNKPEVSGEGATPGAMINVYVDGNPTPIQVEVEPDGTWSVTLPALEDGTHVVEVAEVDPAGNESLKSDPISFGVDTSALVVTIDGAQDDVPAHTDDLNNQDLTNDAAPVLFGTATANSTVVITSADGSTSYGEVDVDAEGKWSLEVTLADGDKTYDFKATLKNSNPAEESAKFELSLDVTEPDAPVIQRIIDDIGDPQGEIAKDGSTDDQTPTLEGTGEPGATIEVFADGQKLGEATVDPEGLWTFTPETPLVTDSSTPIVFTATAIDPAGNTSTPSAPYGVLIDIEGSATAPVISDVRDNEGNAAETVGDGAVTNDSTPEIIGTAVDAATVTLYRKVDGELEVLAEDIPVSNGAWTYTPDTPLLLGTYELVAISKDAAGNPSQSSNTRSFTFALDTTDEPAIINVIDDVDAFTGNVANNTGITNDNQPDIIGTAKANAVVIVYDTFNGGKEVLGSTTADANGIWTLKLDDPAVNKTLADGDHKITAVAKLPGDTISAETGVYQFEVDVNAPDKLTDTVLMDDQGSVTGAIVVNDPSQSTDDNKPEVKGSGEVGATINVFVDGSPDPIQVQVDPDGNWSLTLPELDDGTHIVVVQQIDAAGNAGPMGDPLSFIVDTSDLIISIDGAHDNEDLHTVDLNNNDLTNDSSPALFGSGTFGEVITIKSADGNTTFGSVTVDVNGKWELAENNLSLVSGTHVFQAEVSRGSNTIKSGTFTLEIDIDRPDPPVILNAKDDVGIHQGDVVNNGITDDQALTLEGTSENNAIVVISADGQVLGSTTADSSGNWQFTPATPLPENDEGEQTVFTAIAIDEAGNNSNPSADFKIEIDVTALDTKASITQVIDNEPNGEEIINSGGKTNDITPLLKGALTEELEDGARVDVLRDGEFIGHAIIDPSDNTKWSFQDSGLDDGNTYDYTVRVSDKAGNPGEVSDKYTISVDTSVSNQTPVIEKIADNVDPVETDDIGTGGHTNDVTPLLSGSLTTALAADEQLDVVRNGVVIGQAVIDNSDPTKWTFLDSGQDGETYNYIVRISDGANTGNSSNTYTITIDTKAPDKIAVDLDANSDTFLDFFGSPVGSKDDNKTLEKQVDFSGQLDISEAGGVIVYYAYATDGKLVNSVLEDTNENRVLLQNDNTVYSQANKFVLGSAVVKADGTWIMKMEDSPGSPLLSKEGAIVDGNAVEQYFIHVTAEITDRAGNKSELSDPLDIIIETKDRNANTRDPLILDLDGDGIHTVSINDGVKFDHDGDGFKENSGWVSAQDGLLALDLNNDGKINNGSELFGDEMLLTATNIKAQDGFAALAQYDLDGNNKIDANDAVYDSLRVWVDSDQDGVTDAGELKTLAELNITEISLDSTDTDILDQGNTIFKTGTFVQDNQTKDLGDANLAVGPSSGGTSFVEIIADDRLINNSEIGDANAVLSSLMIKVTIPPATAVDEILVITINGPAGANSFTHTVVAADSNAGFVTLAIPNAVLQNAGLYADGEYTMSLIVSNDIGASTVYPGEVSFDLDAGIPDVLTKVEILNGSDDVLYKNELNQEITIKVGVSASAKVGDVIQLDVNNDGNPDAFHTITAADVGNDVDIKVDGDKFALVNDAVSVTAIVVDEAGNSSGSVNDDSAVQEYFEVSVALDTLHIAWWQSPPDVGFDLSSRGGASYGGIGGRAQMIYTDAPGGTEVVVEITVTAPGYGTQKFDSFTVTVDANGNYQFDAASIPTSVWSNLNIIYCGKPITNVKIEAFIGTRADLESNIALDYATGHTSPLILDLDGDGVETISISEDVRFDLDADGVKDKVGWVSGDDGLLVRDLNNDGVINDGSELFGEHTVKQDGSLATDGFDALRELDSNNDGVFDSNDDAFKEVKIWQDVNSDGISQASELYSLLDAGVESISLQSQSVSEYSEGNWTGLRSSWKDSEGESHDVDDVWFALESGENRVLDLSDLLEGDNIQMDSLDHYLHFEQVGDDLAVYIDETGGFTQESFDKNAATDVVILHDTHFLSTDYEDVMKELIQNNQLIID